MTGTSIGALIGVGIIYGAGYVHGRWGVRRTAEFIKAKMKAFNDFIRGRKSDGK